MSGCAIVGAIVGGLLGAIMVAVLAARPKKYKQLGFGFL